MQPDIKILGFEKDVSSDFVIFVDFEWFLLLQILQKPYKKRVPKVWSTFFVFITDWF